MKYIAAIALMCLALGVPGVNFYHHLELPKINQYKTYVTYEPSLGSKFFVSKHVGVFLNEEIKAPSTYYDLVNLISLLGEGDVITFHLTGFGGEVSSTILLMNAIHRTKAHVIMHVETAVYSGHAYLAVSGDELIMEPLSFLMFHSSSIKNLDCSKETGFDRGTPNQLHCAVLKAANEKIDAEMLASTKVLTGIEKYKISQGYDVYLFKAEVDNRLIPNSKVTDKGLLTQPETTALSSEDPGILITLFLLEVLNIGV